MDYILLHIILTEGLILYVISYNPLHHIAKCECNEHICLVIYGGQLFRGGNYRNGDYGNVGYDKECEGNE
jgi:hypothetical protein